LLEIRESEQSIESYRRQAAATLDEQKRRMRDKILTEIKNVVNSKAKAAGYSMVVDTAAESINSTPVVIYTNNENDITDTVLAQLNAAAPPAALKSLKDADTEKSK
jgi:Skp family chaperone for outer membrane proteins